jgi:YfiH family protein
MINNIYKFKTLKSQKLTHGVSTKFFGSIKNNGIINKKNLKGFLNALGVDIKTVVFPEQVHGSRVVVIPTSVEGSRTTSFGERDSSTTLGMTGGAKIVHIPNADGLITNKKNVFIGIVTADCLPVIFYDGKKSIVGIAHAGYKGLLSGVLPKMLKAMKKMGADVKDMKVAIGPAIGVCCYEVYQERIKMFDNVFKGIEAYQIRDGKYFLDLKNIARQILTLDGIQQKNIEVSDICTKDNVKNFYSFRGEGPKNFGEFATIVGILPKVL